MTRKGHLIGQSESSRSAQVPDPESPATPDVKGESAGKWDWEQALIKRAVSEGMSPTCQHVALLLSTYGDGNGTSIRPTVATLVTVSGRSRATVSSALAYLRSTGWIHQVTRGSGAAKQASLYRLTIPPKV